MPESLDPLSLLVLQVVQTEHERDEWERIATAYRVALEESIQMLAMQHERLERAKALFRSAGLAF